MRVDVEPAFRESHFLFPTIWTGLTVPVRSEKFGNDSIDVACHNVFRTGVYMFEPTLPLYPPHLFAACHGLGQVCCPPPGPPPGHGCQGAPLLHGRRLLSQGYRVRLLRKAARSRKLETPSWRPALARGCPAQKVRNSVLAPCSCAGPPGPESWKRHLGARFLRRAARSRKLETQFGRPGFAQGRPAQTVGNIVLAPGSGAESPGPGSWKQRLGAQFLRRAARSRKLKTQFWRQGFAQGRPAQKVETTVLVPGSCAGQPGPESWKHSLGAQPLRRAARSRKLETPSWRPVLAQCRPAQKVGNTVLGDRVLRRAARSRKLETSSWRPVLAQGRPVQKVGNAVLAPGFCAGPPGPESWKHRLGAQLLRWVVRPRNFETASWSPGLARGRPVQKVGNSVVAPSSCAGPPGRESWKQRLGAQFLRRVARPRKLETRFWRQGFAQGRPVQKVGNTVLAPRSWLVRGASCLGSPHERLCARCGRICAAKGAVARFECLFPGAVCKAWACQIRLHTTHPFFP